MQKLAFTIAFTFIAFSIAPANAHHAFAAVFSSDDAVSVTGTVTKVEWMNPHVWFYVDQKDEKSNLKWAFEMGSPNGLLRLGWRRTTLEPGQEVTVDGYRAKDGSAAASVKSVKLANGRSFSGASSKED